MRKANVSDVFKFARYIDSLDIKKDIFDAQKGKNDVEQIGFDVFVSIFSKAISTESEKGLYQAVSGPFELSVDEIEKLDFDEFRKNFMECYNINTIVNFIKRAGFMVK